MYYVPSGPWWFPGLGWVVGVRGAVGGAFVGCRPVRCGVWGGVGADEEQPVLGVDQPDGVGDGWLSGSGPLTSSLSKVAASKRSVK